MIMKRTKRLLSVFLTLCLLLGMLPTTARAANLIEISTLEELEKFRDEVNSGSVDHSNNMIELTADIDLGGSEANQWTPIGTKSNPFKGIFDGGGHKITGLYINTTNDYSCQGLFGYVGVGGTVSKLGVEGTVKGAGL